MTQRWRCAQSSQGEPRPKKAWINCMTNVKVMLITFFDEPGLKKARMNRMTNVKLMLTFNVRGIIHDKFVEPGPTVNTLYNKTVLQGVKKMVKKKRGSDHHWFGHHDNAPLYCSLIVQQYLTKKAVTSIPHPPYSPDISSCDFFFLQFRQTMKGKWF